MARPLSARSHSYRPLCGSRRWAHSPMGRRLRSEEEAFREGGWRRRSRTHAWIAAEGSGGSMGGLDRDPEGESTLFYTHVQNDPGHAAYASSTKCGAPFRFSVPDPAGKFNDAVMDLNTDRACQQVCITCKFSENLLLNLFVILHFVDSVSQMQHASGVCSGIVLVDVGQSREWSDSLNQWSYGSSQKWRYL